MTRPEYIVKLVREQALNVANEEPDLPSNLKICEELLLDHPEQAESCREVVNQLRLTLTDPWPVGHLSLSLLEFLLSNGPVAFQSQAHLCNDNLKVVARLGGQDGVMARRIWHSITNIQKQIGNAVIEQQLVEESDPHLAKLLTEIKTVKHKINMAKKMIDDINLNPGSVDGEERLALTEFLEQCSPRLVKLINQGATGSFDEQTFQICLEVNDELCATLDDLRRVVEIPVSHVPKLASPPQGESTVDDLLMDFTQMSTSPAGQPPVTDSSLQVQPKHAVEPVAIQTTMQSLVNGTQAANSVQQQQQSTNNTQQQQPTSITQQQPTNNTQQQPTNITQQQPTSITQQQPTSITQQQPTSITQQQPTSITQQQPTSITQQQPTNNTQQQPTNNTQQQPTSITQQQPTNNTQQQPTSITQQQPTNNTQQQPTNITQPSTPDIAAFDPFA